MSATLWAAILAPILGPAIWWALFGPGRVVYRFLWRTLPNGKVRDFLLKERGGEWVTIKPPNDPLP